jgi:hypothetical protein
VEEGDRHESPVFSRHFEKSITTLYTEEQCIDETISLKSQKSVAVEPGNRSRAEFYPQSRRESTECAPQSRLSLGPSCQNLCSEM